MDEETLQRLHELDHGGLQRLGVFIGLWLAAATVGTFWFTPWVLLFTVPVAAGALHGISLFTHEGEFPGFGPQASSDRRPRLRNEVAIEVFHDPHRGP